MRSSENYIFWFLSIWITVWFSYLHVYIVIFLSSCLIAQPTFSDVVVMTFYFRNLCHSSCFCLFIPVHTIWSSIFVIFFSPSADASVSSYLCILIMYFYGRIGGLGFWLSFQLLRYVLSSMLCVVYYHYHNACSDLFV